MLYTAGMIYLIVGQLLVLYLLFTQDTIATIRDDLAIWPSTHYLTYILFLPPLWFLAVVVTLAKPGPNQHGRT